MPIIGIINQDYVNEYLDPITKNRIADDITKRLLVENPFTSQVNASTIRNLVLKILDYNSDYGQHAINEAYHTCTSSTLSIPIDGTPLIITSNERGQILKVCPVCKFTAEVEDSLCPKCNHVYYNHKLEASVVQSALNKLEGVSKGSSVILNDEVEGIKVTKKDIDKYLKDIQKYIP